MGQIHWKVRTAKPQLKISGSSIKKSVLVIFLVSEEEYQKLTAKEESDLNRILNQFEDALANVEEFTEQLSSELQQLEYVSSSIFLFTEC